MRLRLAALLTAPFALALPAVHAQTTVKSLDQVRDVIQTDAAKQMFDQQMSGKPAPDGFGTALPAGFTADFLLRQLAPGQPADRLVLAGAKPWPQRERAYVGVVCLAALPKRRRSRPSIRATNAWPCPAATAIRSPCGSAYSKPGRTARPRWSRAPKPRCP
ncbi:hypothetical protein WJ970_32995 [Achromobacter xylosoxidans]